MLMGKVYRSLDITRVHMEYIPL